jgi:hypothetical protein
MSSCGDGIWDPDGGEACDAGLGPCGDLCSACTCQGGVTTTTTGSGTTGPSSTTQSGGSTTTTTSTMPVLPTTSTTTTTLPGPDLAGVDWMSPGSAPSGAVIAVQFSVKNFGTATAAGGFYDYIMFSTDYAFGGDTALAVVQRASSVSAGSQYTTLVPMVQLPVIAPGIYFLYLQTDGTNAVSETNENNNIGAFVAITIN